MASSILVVLDVGFVDTRVSWAVWVAEAEAGGLVVSDMVGESGVFQVCYNSIFHTHKNQSVG